ncbi:unnamed protein product [Rotaria sp. Silwood1]|nr:unnamed protein product [Rotaria sp. Silwood1]CAF0964817.1 unnamed protein product [Rotaria sp. Silwood1]
MAHSSKAKNNPNIEVLPALIIDRSTAADDNVKYIYINYEKKNWNDVVKDINIYQQITKSKKLEVLKIKSELQEFCQKSRKALMELNENNDIDDYDDYKQFFLNLSPKNIDDFINGELTILVDCCGNLKLEDFGWNTTACCTLDYLAPEIVGHKQYQYQVDN